MNRLRLRADPLRLLISSGPWISAWYLFSYLIAGTVAFFFILALLVASGGFGITVAIIGLPLLAGTVLVIRGCAAMERGRLRAVFTEPVRGRYREMTDTGWLGRLKLRWTDPALWRDLAYLVGLFPPLLVPDLVVFLIWVMLLFGITIPIWYETFTDTCIGYCQGPGFHGIQFGGFSHGAHAAGTPGVQIHTLSGALLVALISLVAFLLFNYVAVATAKLHATIARSLLQPPDDPLREAREVLHSPGPLAR